MRVMVGVCNAATLAALLPARIACRASRRAVNTAGELSTAGEWSGTRERDADPDRLQRCVQLAESRQGKQTASVATSPTRKQPLLPGVPGYTRHAGSALAARRTRSIGCCACRNMYVALPAAWSWAV
ncbi:hypothetical protein ON010_g16380 [Phytophthora cinnamomi]|nr:hypothetical protein ON010_g16380 [Phytophthora cinnamomi]